MKTWITLALLLPLVARAAVQVYGDMDVLGTGTYPWDPTVGAQLEGLAPDANTFGSLVLGHGWGFSPEGDDHPGTDRIFTGSSQWGYHDGYSGSWERLFGPQVVVLDASALHCGGGAPATLTLGIAADDFQYPTFGQLYTASINGTPHASLTNLLNAIDQTGPEVQFFTLGLDPALLDANGQLVLSIDQGGDGGDGWAIDFLTLGVTCDGTVGAHETPAAFALSQNVPNPFNPTTSISFTLAETGAASLKVFDLAGREVATLVNGVLERGAHSVEFDGANLASGVYVYTLQAGATVESRKMVLMK